MQRYCPKCGSEITKGAIFCGNCGTAVNTLNGTNQKFQNQYGIEMGTIKNKNEKKINIYKIIGITGCVLMLISNWLPFIKLDAFGIKVAELSLMDLSSKEDAIMFFAYVGIVCTILCGVLLVVNIRNLFVFILTDIISVLAFSPELVAVLIIEEAKADKAGFAAGSSYSLGPFLMGLSWILMEVAIIAMCIIVGKDRKQSKLYNLGGSGPETSFKATTLSQAATSSQAAAIPLLQKGQVSQSSATPAPAVIRGIKGTFMGADIVLDMGEMLIIGRDPSLCQLVLVTPSVSRKHCSVQFDMFSGMYKIECFSQNGLVLSDNHNVSAGQSVTALRGTQIIIANGSEVLELS